MNRRIFFHTFFRSVVQGLVTSAAVPLNSCAGQLAESVVPVVLPKASANDVHELVVLGDTQRTSWWERTFLGREQHDAERVQVLKAVASSVAEGRTSAVVLLGDHVCYGEEQSDWQYFDEIVAPLRNVADRTKTPLYALVGNHDYGFVWRSASYLESMFSRFPAQPRQFPCSVPLYYSDGSHTVLLMLDSNADMLSDTARRSQMQEYQRVLRDCDDDATVRSVIVAAHHPPYTNSDLDREAEQMQPIAEAFTAAAKTRLFLSGHVHSYERFSVQPVPSVPEKFFIISGGGGGPRRNVSILAQRRYTNDRYRVGELRPFHYVRLSVGISGLRGECQMLRNGEWSVGDEFSLQW